MLPWLQLLCVCEIIILELLLTLRSFLSSYWLLQVSIYLIQIIFGAVDVPAKLLALGMLSYLGRRVSQATCLFMSALVIFANIFVPAGNTHTHIHTETHR